MPTIEELRAARPPDVGVARVLLIIAVVLWMPEIAALYGPSGGGLVALAMFLAVFGSFGVVKGRQSARLMTTIALGLAVVLMVPYCWLGFRDELNPYGSVYAMIDIAAVALAACTLGLLYHPNTNRYIDGVTAALRAGETLPQRGFRSGR